MGSLIGVLSTVILVSTVCTLIFAVGAYVISRKGRDGVGDMNEKMPGEDMQDQFPHSDDQHKASSMLFKRAELGAGGASQMADNITDEEYQWK